MPHQPAWHIISSEFTQQNDGLAVPTRNLGALGNDAVDVARTAEQQQHVNTLVIGQHGLRINNRDRADPPGYAAGAVPRSAQFNTNVFNITAAPRMPPLAIQCQHLGFDPATTPIHWRLQCRHVLCRYTNVGTFRYEGACEILEDEWQGTSAGATFTLFADPADANVALTYNTAGADAPVMGGHAILSVAARPPGAGITLLDYVHLRIGGTNPGQAEVLLYVDTQLSTRNANILHMVRAIFAHEADYHQFSASAQRQTSMNFTSSYHGGVANQPDCRVVFDWPDDPANFPLASFDFGVGISQYTRVGGRNIPREVAWDWRENIDIGVNTFMASLRATRARRASWRAWALAAWAGYNGSGQRARDYAANLEQSTEGQLVSADAIPQDLDLNAEAQDLPAAAARPAAPAWPPPP